MDAFEARGRIAAGEGHHTEFKATLGDREEAAKDLVCFANADGGVILYGIADDGAVAGIEDPDDLAVRIDQIGYDRCEPPITTLVEVVELDDGAVVAVTVPKSSARPHRTRSGRFYLRVGTRCRQPSREDLLRLFQATESLFYDETTLADTSLADLDLDALDRYLDRVDRPELAEQDPEKLLRNWGLYRNGDATIAGVVLFGHDPQRHLPYAKVVAATFAGTDASDEPIDRTDITGRLGNIVDQCARYLDIALTTRHRIRGFEPERQPELSPTALREAVVNALAHRDYTVRGPVRLFVFEDRVEIHTPGRPPNTVDEEAMRAGVHVVRNPRIYARLFEVGLVTQAGTGVPRIVRLVREATGRDVKFRISEAEVVVTLPRTADAYGS